MIEPNPPKSRFLVCGLAVLVSVKKHSLSGSIWHAIQEQRLLCPDLVPRKLVFPCVFFSQGLVYSQTPVFQSVLVNSNCCGLESENHCLCQPQNAFQGSKLTGAGPISPDIIFENDRTVVLLHAQFLILAILGPALKHGPIRPEQTSVSRWITWKTREIPSWLKMLNIPRKCLAPGQRSLASTKRGAPQANPSPGELPDRRRRTQVCMKTGRKKNKNI